VPFKSERSFESQLSMGYETIERLSYMLLQADIQWPRIQDGTYRNYSNYLGVMETIFDISRPFAKSKNVDTAIWNKRIEKLRNLLTALLAPNAVTNWDQIRSLIVKEFSACRSEMYDRIYDARLLSFGKETMKIQPGTEEEIKSIENAMDDGL
jgi:hypothetical protein